MKSRRRAVVAGLLIAAGLPPWGWWPLSLAGIATWYRLLDGLDARARASRSFLVGLSWAVPTTIWMIDLTPAGWPVTLVIFSIFFGLAGLLTPASGSMRRLAFPAAVVLVELIRWNWPFGGTPIATFAMVGVATPFSIAARLFGSPLLVVLMVVAGIGFADLRSARFIRAIGMGAVLLAATIGGHLSGTRTEAVGEIDVAVVQGGGPQNTRADTCETRAVFERHMTASETIDRPVDLVLWPEDVVHPFPDSARTPSRCDTPILTMSEAAQRLSDHGAKVDAVMVTGWFHRADDGTANVNYSIAQSPDGAVTDRYDKVRLVPFGEFVPLRSFIERFSDELPNNDVRPGTEPATLDTDVGRLGISISWEVFFDHRARDAIGNGGQVLLNPTNGSSYWLTIVQTQQIASSRLRAIETDRWVLQAAPTGFSASISPGGTVRDRTGVSEQRVIYDTIELREGRTLAVAWGAWPVLIWSLVSLARVWWPEFRRRRLPASA